MRYALIALMLFVMSGCSSQTVVPDTYRYDDIPLAMEGNWIGYAKSTSTSQEYGFMLNLKRSMISNIFYLTEECSGRLKYQRTENNLHYLYLEQIDIDSRRLCEPNSYVRFTPGNDNDTVIYTRHNMKGKVVTQGLLTRQQ